MTGRVRRGAVAIAVIGVLVVGGSACDEAAPVVAPSPDPPSSTPAEPVAEVTCPEGDYLITTSFNPYGFPTGIPLDELMKPYLLAEPPGRLVEDTIGVFRADGSMSGEVELTEAGPGVWYADEFTHCHSEDKLHPDLFRDGVGTRDLDCKRRVRDLVLVDNPADHLGAEEPVQTVSAWRVPGSSATVSGNPGEAVVSLRRGNGDLYAEVGVVEIAGRWRIRAFAGCQPFGYDAQYGLPFGFVRALGEDACGRPTLNYAGRDWVAPEAASGRGVRNLGFGDPYYPADENGPDTESLELTVLIRGLLRMEPAESVAPCP